MIGSRKPFFRPCTALSIAVLVLFPAFLGSSILISTPKDIPFTSLQFALDKPNASQASGSLQINMSLLSTGTYRTFPVTLSRGNMYNFTARSTGSATFDVTLVENVTVLDYFNQKTTSVFSDEILRTAGVPWWAGYNTWNTISFSSRVTQGATVASGTNKSFRLYIDDSYVRASIPCTLIAILKSTVNTNDNLLELSWNTISLQTPALSINYTNNSSGHAALFSPGTASLIMFGTKNNVVLTSTILNETVSTNSTLTLVHWQKDLSGNVRRGTVPSIGIVNDVYVPSFRNVELDGSVLPAFIINPSTTSKASLSWNFSAVTDPSVTYSNMPLADSVVNFTLTGLNRAFRVIDLNGATYFDINFQENILYTQLNWNVAAQFFAIGRDATAIYNLNARGFNESESASIFTTSQDAAFTNTATSFTTNKFTTHRFWIAGYGSEPSQVSTQTGTNKLGIIITATQSLAYLNFSCLVNITTRSVQGLSSSEEMEIGTSLGYPHDPFQMFHVRQFTFQDYTQFKWGIRTFNATPVISDANLYCNDGNTYPRDLNNALISMAFSTTGLTGTINLNYEISGRMQANDILHVYVKNATGTYQVTTETGVIGTPISRTFPITAYSGSQVQIIFNFTTNDMGSGELGPVIDDVRVGNATNAVFQDDFQGTLSKWTQIDNNGGSAMYWHVASDSTAFNRPAITVVYPNQVSTLYGYYAQPAMAGVLKEIFGVNPAIQSNHVGYAVIMADGNIVQNFTTIVSATPYNPVEIQDGTVVASNLEYTQLGITYPLADFYHYYYVDLEPGYRYGISIEMEGLSTLYINGVAITKVGTNATSAFDRFYGFFVINMSYSMEPTTTGRVYIKFATIAPDTTFTIHITKVSTAPEFPWLLTIMIASIAVNAIFGYVLAYNRRVLTLPKRRAKAKI